MSVIALSLVGPTASGKSAVALELARRDRTLELVSVDSMQVYRGMDIGTAKPTRAEQADVPHHLIDLVDPVEEYDVARFQADMADALAAIEARGHRAVLVGGTGLYLRAAIDGLTLPGRFPEVRAELDAEPDTVALHRRLAALDPVGAARMEPTNRRRVIRALEVTVGSGRPFSSFGPGLESYPPLDFPIIGLELDRAQLDERIERRFARQLEDGFLDEVRGLRARSPGLSRSAGQALGYRELLAHLDGELELGEAVDLAISRTRRFARRQQRWFRRDPRVIPVPSGHNALVAIDERLGD
ncbi:MAG: tRNA (adenosine(37)-N6)-dimethylallyltransferase MiaA [Acidimicrobiales bacterium]